MSVLPRSFYRRDTTEVARDLLGMTLVRRAGGTVRSGIITETEAYGSRDDPASHAFGRVTPRNRAMFGEVGRAYVYFTYGMHYCVNAVAYGEGSPAGAVLIRSLKPVSGLDEMAECRGTGAKSLTGGPAMLAQALGITGEQYGEDLTTSGGLSVRHSDVRGDILAGPRVGIKKGTELQWNFVLRQE